MILKLKKNKEKNSENVILKKQKKNGISPKRDSIFGLYNEEGKIIEEKK